jgi:hypothetical protein
MGTVTVKALGKVREKSSTTLVTGALMRLTRTMKMTNVNTEAPMSPCERTSFRMYRVKMRTTYSA